MLQKWFSYLIKGMDFNTLKIKILPYIAELRNFHFSLFNPLFWISLLVLFLILLRFWDIRKSCSFCFVISILLLVTSKTQSFISDIVTKSGFTFDPIFIRMIFFFILSFVLLYYIFIK